MKTFMKKFVPIAVLLLFTLLVACSSPPDDEAAVAEVTEAPIEAAQPTDTPEPPTDTPEPPTDTPEPPTDTPTPVPTDSPTPTDTPEPPTDTPTPTDTPSPTDTPTPAIPKPQPGATLTGDMESSEIVGNGTINLKLSEDGTSISNVDFNVIGPLEPVDCSGGSLGSVGELSQNFEGPFPIEDGNIDSSLSQDGELKGKFTSPTEASGTIDINVKFSILGTSFTCNFGTWSWSAEAN